MSGWGLPLKSAAARGWRVLPVVLTACLLAACGQVGPPVEEAVPDAVPPDRTPVILVPGVSREVGAELRGGRLMPFSVLALRTDAEALANLGDLRFPAGGSRPLTIPARLDRRCAARRSEACAGSSAGWFKAKATYGAIRSNPWTRTTPRILSPSGTNGLGWRPCSSSITTGVATSRRALASWPIASRASEHGPARPACMWSVTAWVEWLPAITRATADGTSCGTAIAPWRAVGRRP
jgi:hypothetical protein